MKQRERMAIGRIVSRKGILFTLVALLTVAILAVVLLTSQQRDPRDSFEGVQYRVNTMDVFLRNLGRDSERAAYVSGFRSLIAMEQYVTSNGRPLSNPSAAFMEAFINGTVNGTSMIIMQNATFTTYLRRVQDDAAAQGLLCNATIVQLSLWQSDPWHLRVNYTLQLYVTDVQRSAEWNTNRTFVGTIPITDIRDPLFSMNTYSRIQRVIKSSNVTIFVNDTGDRNDTSGLMLHFNRSYYIAAGRGPNILMRFANDTSDSVYGIESLVDTDEFIAQSLPTYTTASVVDYVYFNNTPAQVCTIQNTPTRIKLRNTDLVTYQVQGQLTYNGC